MPVLCLRVRAFGEAGAMGSSMMFLDCPAYLDQEGTVRCGLPAEVQYRYIMESSDRPVESVMTRCPSGHCFKGPIEFLGPQIRH
jgi:hypothetical protein